MRRVYAYLLKLRFIGRDVISFFAHQDMLYKDAGYHNAVFVGFDEHGIACTSSASGYKGNVTGSQPEHSFHWMGTSGRLYVFEAPVDLLSYVTLNPDHWQEHSYAALCCVGLQAAVYQAQHNPHISEIVVCTDHDEAGIEAYYRIKDELRSAGSYRVRQELACNKDWSEDIRVQHGLAPIPAGEHTRMAHIQALCRQLIADGLSPCPSRPLETLQEQGAAMKQADFNNQAEIQEPAYSLTGLALAFCQKRTRQLGLDVDTRRIVTGMFSLYQPHRDHIGYRSRIQELEDCMRELHRQFGTDRIYTKSELKQQINQTLGLALNGLRLHAYIEQQEPEQSVRLAM